ncbi:unnamed protein product [Absidia cylindrospora]
MTSQPEWGEFSSLLISLVAITITCSLFGVKTFNVNYRQLTYARWLVVMLYICSWTFTASTAILASTNNGNYTSCFLSIMACDLFYCGTKFILYLWLIERAYIADDGRKNRTDSWSYRFHILLMTPYIAIFTLMIIYHNSILTSTGECYIGLQPIANIPVLVYDTIFNLYMTVLFVIPLIRVGRGVNAHDWKSSRLYDLTKRSLIASSVCLVASFANALGATIMHGKQRGYLCMMCCTIDVTINVLTIHWVTTPSKVKHRGQCTGAISRLSSSSLDAHIDNKKHLPPTMVASSSSQSNPDSVVAAPSSIPVSNHHQQQQQHYDQNRPSSSSSLYYHHGNRSSISISKDSQCSTKSLTNSPVV